MALDYTELMKEARQERPSQSRGETSSNPIRSLVDEVLDEEVTSRKSNSDLLSTERSPAKTATEESLFARPVYRFVSPLLEGGGMAAGILATTPLSPIGQAAGGALGYAGGRALADIAEGLAGERPTPPSIGSAIKRTGELLEEGGIAEAGGRLLGKTAEAAWGAGKSLIRMMVSGQAKPITAEQQLIVNTANEMGIQMRPSEVTGSDAAAQVEQNARRSIFGVSKFQKLDEKNSRNMLDFYDALSEKVWGQAKSKVETGRLIQEAVEGQVIPDVQAVNRGLFQTLQQQTGDAAIVATGSVLPKAQLLETAFDAKVFPKSHAIASKIAEIASERGPSTGLTVSRQQSKAIASEEVVSPIKDSLGRDITHVTKEVPSRLLGLGIVTKSETPRVAKTLTFMEAHDARSMLLDLTRTGETLSPREARVAGDLAVTLDTAMANAAKSFDAKHGTAVYQDWRIANSSIVASHELFDSSVIRRAVSSTPEDVVKISFNRDAITETRRVMEALEKSPHGLAQYQQGAFKELMERAMDRGHLNPQKLADVAYGRTGVGDTVMKQTFRELEPELKRFINTASKINTITVYANTHPGQTHTSLINWFEQGMILSTPVSVATGIASGHPITGAIASGGVGLYAISIDQLARLVNSPAGLRLLNKAATLSPKSEAGARVGSLLLKELAKDSDTKEGQQ